MSEYQCLQILDELGFPINSNKLLFSSLNNILVYTLGSNIIYYNLNNNTKTFLQMASDNEIIALKYIDNDDKLLLTVNNNPTPLFKIWDLKNFENIFNQEISIKEKYGIDFSFNNIFIAKIKNDYFIILIPSNNCNDYILYKFYLLNGKYYIEPFFSLINQINNTKNNKNIIIDFKFFLNSKIGIIIYKTSIDFCEIDLDNDKNCTIKKNINYNFNILPYSISISKEYNFLSFITSKGNCLIYDINYINRETIKPYNQDDFIISKFFKDSLYLGTNNGKIYVYQLSDYKLKYYINYNKLYLFKKEFQINNVKNNNENNNNNSDNDYDGPSIDYLDIDETNDKIFIKMGDNSILLSPISFIIDNNNGYINEKIKGNSPLLFAYNHSTKINDIEFFPLSYNEVIDYQYLNDKMQTVFYSCSKEQIIIKYYINHEDNKLYNQYFDFSHIFNDNKNHKLAKENNNNNKYMNYFNVIKFHPKQKNYLYMGDQKGCLYILDINKNNIIYKQYIGETYSIDSLSFNTQGNLIIIGLETGYQSIYYVNNFNIQQKFEKYIILNNHYLSPEDIEIRTKNNHVLSYSNFFNQSKLEENKIIYMKSKNRIECALIIEKNNNYKQILFDINIKNIILDVKMHKGEKFIIILDDNLKINIYDLMSKNIAGIIDLSGQVKYIYHIDIDISGLYISLLCQLKDNNIEKSDIVLFETGTGNVHSFISGLNPIIKTKFDYSGKYLITAGINGEICLLGLDEDAVNSIQNVIEEMNKNPKFLEEYEISYDSTKDNVFLNNIDKNLNNKFEKKFDFQLKNNNDNESGYNNYKKNLNQSNGYDNNYSFKNKYIENNSSLNINNKAKNKYITDNNIFNNISNRENNSKTFKYKTFPNVTQLTPFYSTKNFKYNNLNTNNTQSSSRSKSTYRFNYNDSINNKYSDVPKLSYINIVNEKFKSPQNNNRLFINDRMKLNSYIKTKKEIQIKNINKAINELMYDENKEKDENINSNTINKFSFTNNLLNNNLSSFYSYDTYIKNKFSSKNDLTENMNISKDFMFINNKKINQPLSFDKNIINSNNTTFLIYHKDKHKKYPEPKDIDNIENYYFINNNISNFLK